MTPVRKHRCVRGFGLVDVVACIVLIAFGAVLVLGCARRHGYEHSSRVKCASNLRQIGQGLLLYSNENKQAYPRVAQSNEPIVRFYTGEMDESGSMFDGINDPQPNDVTAVFFLLVRTQDMGTEVFTCPVTDSVKYEAADLAMRGNFAGKQNLDYALAMPYVPDSVKGYQWNANLGPEFAVAADMGPGPALASIDVSKLKYKEVAKLNSPNHEGYGQNVLFGDGHVEFSNTPAAGVNRDYIYGPNTVAAPTVTQPFSPIPLHANDSVLLPYVTDGPTK